MLSATCDDLCDNKKNGQPKLSVKVGHHIEISNRFIRDYVAVFQIAKQCKALPCHKPPLSALRLR